VKLLKVGLVRVVLRRTCPGCKNVSVPKSVTVRTNSQKLLIIFCQIKQM